jgi:hypothetical protein
MPYIGHSPEVAQRRYESVDDISGSFNGSTTSFALQVGGVTPAPFPVASENVLISVGGVIQEPDGTGTNGFQLTGTNIVFSSAPAAGQSFFGVILAGADYVTAGHAFPDGDAAGPSITFSQDLDTGVFRVGSGAIGFGGDGSERARLDGSGRLLLGTTTARAAGDVTAPLQVEGTGFNTSSLNLISNAGANTGNVSHISLAKSRGTSDGSSTVVASGDSLGTLQFCGADGTDLNSTAASISAAVDGTPGSNDMPGRLVFSTTADGASSPTERARFDSSGRLLVGLTNAREHLNDGSDSAHIFLEGTTQNTSTLAVIRSSNNDGPAHLVLGKSRGGKGSTTVVQSGDTIGHINFEGADGDHLVRAAQISCLVDGTPGSNDMPGRLSFKTTPDGSNSLTERMRIRQNGEQQHFGTLATNINIANTASAGNSYEFFYCQHSSTGLANGTNSFKVTTNGNVSNTNNSYGSLSDQRLKENIVDATSQWDDIKGLQVRKYNFREASGHETHTQLGLIAQEVESVSPGLVQTTPVKEGEIVLDADGNQLESIKSINYSVLYMKAVKALQEAQTKIETLETQNTAQQTTIDSLLARVTALEAA